MIKHSEISESELKRRIRSRSLRVGGNLKLRVYGTLGCKSGKRMKRENRVFFSSEVEAVSNGFRPCGNCMHAAYKEWKNNEQLNGTPPNILSHQGAVYYYGKILTSAFADHYLNTLLDSIEWRHDRAIMFGKEIVTKRKVAWYADEPFSYTYSKVTKTALPWTETLLQIKQLVELKSGDTYNSCLLNLYHDGGEGMAWHSDGERDLKKHAAIGSLSLGAERKFSFKHKKTKETIACMLEHGSLLVMKGETQAHWQHRLPTTKTIQTPRVNLTFRSILPTVGSGQN